MKLLAYILSFYILFSTVVPCSLLDNCEEEFEEQASTPFPQNDCNDCTPFSICSTGHGFAISSESLLEAPLITIAPVLYREIKYCAHSDYYFTHFQPPRIA